jgi:phosphoglycolate phosphatase
VRPESRSWHFDKRWGTATALRLDSPSFRGIIKCAGLLDFDDGKLVRNGNDNVRHGSLISLEFIIAGQTVQTCETARIAMRYSLVVWDFDGTLADTMSLAVATYNELAARYGFRRVDDPVAIRGLSARAFLRQHGISFFRLPMLVKEYLAATRGSMETIRLFDGLPQILDRLGASGVRQGVLSSNSEANIRVCLRANGVEALFDFVVGYPRLFGKGRALRRILKKEGIAPTQLLYIGDEVRDVEAASQAGVDVAAVAWGFNAQEQLSRASPTHLWMTPGDVLPAL